MSKFLEIETKYNANDIDLMSFKRTVISLNPKSFLYVCSTDTYFSKGDDFIRYRSPPLDKTTNRSELTLKKKHVSNNNIVRTEVNLRVDSNEDSVIFAFCENLGYVQNFSICKMCHIYFFEDANIVFYTVIDNKFKENRFIEIEVDENMGFMEQEGRQILDKYEKLLLPLGLTSKNRMKRSLWEMYKKEEK